MPGKFITFEGIEGCGKTTQIKLLKDYLISKGFEVVLTREPGGTKIGDQIRKILLLAENKNMFPVAELLLYAAARNQHVEELIKPAIQDGKVVLCDRYADATTAYQGAARRIDLEILEQIHIIATQGLKPELTIVLDLPAKNGLVRAIARNKEESLTGIEDRFEQEKIDFHERVRDGYLKIAEREPLRVKVVNADQTIEDIHKNILDKVNKIIK